MSRAGRGAAAQARGLGAEAIACAALIADGWTILGRRLRTPAGEIDIVARKDDLAAFIEVKSRPTLAGAAESLTPRQQRRLLSAAETLIAGHPDWAGLAFRFDVIAIDAGGTARRIADAFRSDGYAQ